MIAPLDIVNQIQANTKIFKFIGMIAEFSRILDEVPNYTPQLPACFVCFKSSNATENTSLNGYLSVEEMDISIFVVLDTSTDITGANGMCIDWADCNADLRKCLMNWVPNDVATMPMSYTGSDFIKMSGSRIIYESRFEITQQLTEQDGYLVTYDDLKEIDIDSKYYKDNELVEEIETISN